MSAILPPIQYHISHLLGKPVTRGSTNVVKRTPLDSLISLCDATMLPKPWYSLGASVYIVAETLFFEEV